MNTQNSSYDMIYSWHGIPREDFQISISQEMLQQQAYQTELDAAWRRWIAGHTTHYAVDNFEHVAVTETPTKVDVCKYCKKGVSSRIHEFLEEPYMSCKCGMTREPCKKKT